VATENPFIKILNDKPEMGKAHLRQLYLATVKKTHPDSVGSDHLTEQFITYRENYVEAFNWLAGKNEEKVQTVFRNPRFSFYLALYRFISSYTNPFAEKLHQPSEEELQSFQQCFHNWKPQYAPLFSAFCKEYLEIQKIRFPKDLQHLRFPVLSRRLAPFMHNISRYHLTGKDFYLQQLERERKTLLEELTEQKYTHVKEMLMLWIKDLHKGPALWD